MNIEHLRILIIAVLVSYHYELSAQSFVYTSINTNDTYTIHINIPENYSSSKEYGLILYFDYDLKSGQQIRKVYKSLETSHEIKPQILVGIKQHGHNATKRRRDFIQGHEINRTEKRYFSNNPNYGQSALFYQFIIKELLPKIEGNYKINQKTIVGHSLSGLFVIYCLLEGTEIFDNFLAISPSLWVNHQNIFQIEDWYSEKNHQLKGKFYISCGTYETVNLIKHHVELFHNRLQNRKYEGLIFKRSFHIRKTHITVIEPSLREGLMYLCG